MILLSCGIFLPLTNDIIVLWRSRSRPRRRSQSPSYLEVVVPLQKIQASILPNYQRPHSFFFLLMAARNDLI